jgi:transcriptional regulator of acetoin/glycerol metabolism
VPGRRRTRLLRSARAAHAQFERDYLQRLLHECHGNISQAAAEARLPRGTFYRLLNRHALG